MHTSTSISRAFEPLTPGLHVVYGRRGVGKTTILLQVLKEHKGDGRAILTRKDLALAERLDVKEKVMVVRRSSDFTSWLRLAAEILPWSRFARNPLLIVSIPLELILAPLDEHSMRYFGRFLVVLALISETARVFLEIAENPKLMLPYRYFLFIEIAEDFFHVARGRRLRVLSRVHVPMPEIGETWSHEDVREKLKFERRALLAPLPDKWGFRVLRLIRRV